MTWRSWLFVGAAVVLALMAWLLPSFSNGIEDASATAVPPVKEHAAINDPVPSRPPALLSRAAQAVKQRVRATSGMRLRP